MATPTNPPANPANLANLANLATNHSTGRETIAVMDGSHILCNDGRSWPLHPEKLNDGVLYAHVLAKTVRDLGIHQLWIHPSWPGVLDWSLPGHAAANGAGRWTFGGVGDPREHWHVCFQAGTYGAVDIVETAKDTRAPWRTAGTADELLAALTQFQKRVGVEYKRSPGSTGVRLIRWAHGPKSSINLDVPGEMPAPALAPALELPRQWMRALTSAERQRRYLHSFDKNGMYVAACSSLALGVGDAVHVTADDLDGGESWPGVTRTKSGKETFPPGYWSVHVAIPRTKGVILPETISHLPLPFALPPKGKSLVWMTTPTLMLLRELGYETCITEAFIWTRHHRYLEQWYHAIRTARADLMEAAKAGELGAALALAVLKNAYAAASGRLNTQRWDRSEDTLYRPDWRHAMIAQANATVYRQGLNAVKQGYTPFALGTDAWYFVSDEPDPVAACPPALTLGDNLGAWKVKDSVPLDAILPVLDAGAGKFGALQRMQRALNHLRKGETIPADLLGEDDNESNGRGE